METCPNCGAASCSCLPSEKAMAALSAPPAKRKRRPLLCRACKVALGKSAVPATVRVTVRRKDGAAPRVARGVFSRLGNGLCDQHAAACIDSWSKEPGFVVTASFIQVRA